MDERTNVMDERTNVMDERTLERLADMICGGDQEKFFVYRTNDQLINFFERYKLKNQVHDYSLLGGSIHKMTTNESSREKVALKILQSLTKEQLEKVILRLANPIEYQSNKANTYKAIACLNTILALEGYKIELKGIKPQLKECEAYLYEDLPDNQELPPSPKPDFSRLNIDLNFQKFSHLVGMKLKFV